MKITRRRFMNQSAATVGLAATMTAKVRANVAGANERIRFGAIGTGGMGRGDIRTFFNNPDKDLECPVICDVDDEQLVETQKLLKGLEQPEAATVKDFREVTDRKDIDVVLVATPDHWHPLPTIYACQSGKDVYCEKPLANSIGECRAVAKVARDTGRIVQMGTQWRMGTHWREAVEFIHSGKLGKVRLVRCFCALGWFPPIQRVPEAPVPSGVDYDMWLGPAPKRPFNPMRFHRLFRWFWDYAGGLQTDWGVHLLNIALWAMKAGIPERVSSAGGPYVSDGFADAPDTQNTIFDFGKFTLVWEHLSGSSHGPDGTEHGCVFYGENGTLKVHTAGWELKPQGKGGLEPVERKISEDGELCRVKLVGQLLDSVKTRKQTEMNPDWGGYVTTVALLGNLALRSGGAVCYDAENMRVTGNDEANELITNPYRAPWKLPEL
jgi:predicted dehydrogenase